MKKLKKTYKKRLFRLAKRAASRKLRSKKKKVVFKSLTRINAPKTINLTRGSGLELMEFIDKVRKAVAKNRHVRLNFFQTRHFYVPGAIKLYAELSLIVEIAKLKGVRKVITIVPPKENRAAQVMKQIGFFVLSNDTYDIKTTRDDVIYWKLATGTNQSGEKLEILDTVAKTVNLKQQNRIEASGLWRGVSEAVNNAHEHAYSVDRKSRSLVINTKWWMLTQVRDNTLTLAVCDLGCGYKLTIKQEIWEFISKSLTGLLLGNQNEDTRAIRGAMEYGRSSTNKTERGKGSRDAMTLLESVGNIKEPSTLYVLSNKGYLIYSYDGKETKLKSTDTLDFDSKGSIVWWNLQLGE